MCIFLKVGLGDIRYGTPMIGQLIAWPLVYMPNEIWPEMSMEFIPYLGQTFDPIKYPLLSQLHPKNKLPTDMRGNVPRGWDNGRGVDVGRELMSEQRDAIRNITGTVATVNGGIHKVTGAFKANGEVFPQIATNTMIAGLQSIDLDVSLVVPVAEENRVKNVAWNMIVRAK
ncbi:hypothetical protein [Cedecea sp. NFIX57]|uniref:hypothetical protein n=1 Tax=Cedecea sp. NFIX57 TaxID=1566286 RepID=UPI000A0ACF5B|nr:hypothetical protein [Cedecea sp. NFIX57]SMG51842.1 hypothetical protein SAMN03159353_101448 [Cedecea sp. NFIX57]